jgi:hypothetical protein
MIKVPESLVALAIKAQDEASGNEYRQMEAVIETVISFLGEHHVCPECAMYRGTGGETVTCALCGLDPVGMGKVKSTTDGVAVVDAMEKAYAEVTGIGWVSLHINHRAGLSAAMVAGLQTLGFEQKPPPGPCGNRPISVITLTNTMCSLLHGHAGMHTNGVTSWTERDRG